MKLWPIIILSIVIMSRSYSQDERSYKKLFIEKDSKEGKYILKQPYTWQIKGSLYNFDINGDGILESFYMSKKDAEDWFVVLDDNQNKIFESHLLPRGFGSHLFKINLRILSPKSKVLILHFFDGHVGKVQFYSSITLYFITFEKNDLKTMKMYKGPQIWDEKFTLRNHYHRRYYKVDVFDYNKDGIREISIHHHDIARIYYYKGFGRWTNSMKL